MKHTVGIWTATLVDDGTLDTVIRVHMNIRPHINYDIRFCQEYAAAFRDPGTGEISQEDFRRLAREAVDETALMHEFR